MLQLELLKCTSTAACGRMGARRSRVRTPPPPGALVPNQHPASRALVELVAGVEDVRGPLVFHLLEVAVFLINDMARIIHTRMPIYMRVRVCEAWS